MKASERDNQTIPQTQSAETKVEATSESTIADMFKNRELIAGLGTVTIERESKRKMYRSEDSGFFPVIVKSTASCDLTTSLDPLHVLKLANEIVNFNIEYQLSKEKKSRGV